MVYCFLASEIQIRHKTHFLPFPLRLTDSSFLPLELSNFTINLSLGTLLTWKFTSVFKKRAFKNISLIISSPSGSCSPNSCIKYMFTYWIYQNLTTCLFSVWFFSFFFYICKTVPPFDLLDYQPISNCILFFILLLSFWFRRGYFFKSLSSLIISVLKKHF